MAVSSRTTIAGPTGDVTVPRCGDHATHASAVAAAESSTSRRSRITPMVMAARPRITRLPSTHGHCSTKRGSAASTTARPSGSIPPRKPSTCDVAIASSSAVRTACHM